MSAKATKTTSKAKWERQITKKGGEKRQVRGARCPPPKEGRQTSTLTVVSPSHRSHQSYVSRKEESSPTAPSSKLKRVRPRSAAHLQTPNNVDG